MPLVTSTGTELLSLNSAGNTMTVLGYQWPDETPPSTDWSSLFASRNLPGLEAWYVANTGHRALATRSYGNELIDATWLANNSGNGNVWFADGRWVIERISATGLRVVANNVTIRDCLVQAGGGYHGIVAPVGEDPTGIIIEHCTLDGQAADWLGVQFPEASAANQIIVRRCNITGFRCGIQIIGGIVAEENWIHDLYYDAVDPHVTSISIRARNVTVRRNRLADGNSAALAFYNETSPYTNIRAEQNIISTNQAIWEVAYLGSYPAGANTVEFIDNLFERGALAYQAGNFSSVSGNSTINGTPVN